MAGVTNRVSGRKKSAGEKKSLHGLDVCFVAEGSGFFSIEHWITVGEYNNGLKVREPRTRIELEILSLHC